MADSPLVPSPAEFNPYEAGKCKWVHISKCSNLICRRRKIQRPFYCVYLVARRIYNVRWNYLSICELSPTFVVKRLTSCCTVASYPAVQLTVSVARFVVQLIWSMLLKVALHICCNEVCKRRVVTQCKSYNGKLFFRGYGKGKVKKTSLLLSFFVVVNIEISYM